MEMWIVVKILVKWQSTFPQSDTTAGREEIPRYMIGHKGIMTMQTPFFLDDRMDLKLAFDCKTFDTPLHSNMDVCDYFCLNEYPVSYA